MDKQINNNNNSNKYQRRARKNAQIKLNQRNTEQQ